MDSQPHARAVLGPALPPGRASHAYLFYGPRGSGKRAVARGFATALLADGAADEAGVVGRVGRGTHPDLTWVSPGGAAEMLVSDIDEPVVAAATLSPFEARRRVFVIEGAQALNESAANRLLKTLEEPHAGVHLILLADDRSGVLPTIASRCQPVRFDPPSSDAVAAALVTDGVPHSEARACARLALGDAVLARWLAGQEGAALRAQSEALVATALQERVDPSAWLALLDAAKEAGRAAAEAVRAAVAEQAERLPSKEARRHVREGADAEKRAQRRRRSEILDLGLRLGELWLRDVWCMAQGASEVIHASDREAELRGYLRVLQGRRLQAAGPPADGPQQDTPPDAAVDGERAGTPSAESNRLACCWALARGMDLIAETRMRLALNVSEELALEALVYRLGERLTA